MMVRFSLFLNLFLISFLLVGCYPTIDSRGYNPETMDVKKIQIGVDTMQTIQERFGSPSTSSAFGDENKGHNWYYISKRTSTTSFYRPETLEQQTIVLRFDAQGIVRDVAKYEGEHPVIPIDRKTETTGYETSIMRDIFGNFGRYSSQSKNKPGP
ncbi:MAG: outer membrane protein assembly factor BamE [Alphaproteobacteria bacterium]|jgi:outer membrane protein assembly factor BamE (lipoprotein component of BamABCDE complex)|nr:outer membrane protein assembly factor BamE [Alphaproteobacteria bacterium]